MKELMYVPEIPWKGLGTQYTNQPDSVDDLVNQAKLGWEVSALPMYTDRDDHVGNFNAIYREDTQSLLGVVNRPKIEIVQNNDMFLPFGGMIGRSVTVDTASNFDGGRIVFGSFKIPDKYKLLDDDIDHYLVVLNDHLKPDGKISVLHTPVRIVCQNTLEQALHKNIYHLRLPIGEDVIDSVSQIIMNSMGDAILDLNKKSEELYSRKVELGFVDKVMDELFPFPNVEEDTILHSKAMESIEMERDMFRQCLDVDNLNNYRNTQYWVFQALVDYDQHVVKNINNAYDLSYRMRKLSGVGTPSEPSRTAKFLKIADQLAA